MKRYSITVFDRTLAFKYFSEVIKVENLVYDYVSQEKTKMTILGQLSLARTDYVTLCVDELPVFQGVVSDYKYDRTYTTITLLPLESMIDIDVFTEVNEVNDQKITLESWVSEQLKAVFNGADTCQNITNMVVRVGSSTYGTIEEDKNNIYNLYDVVTDLLKVYGILLTMSFNISERKVYIDITNTDVDEFFVIDTSEPDVMDYSLKTASNKKPNKILYLNSEYYSDKTSEEDKEGMTPQLTFYWHPDGFSGSVDQSSSQPRLLPVSLKIKSKKKVEEKKDKDGNVTTEAKTFEEVCAEDAYDSMYRTSYDDQIELTVKSGSNVVEIGEIGARYLIIMDECRYYTMLTSKEVVDDKTQLLTFGMARTRLTQIVRENWRITNNESS